VAALNPHAGEHGLFGREEIDEIQPALEWARAQGMPVEGQLTPDTVFYLAVRRGIRCYRLHLPRSGACAA
jgi:4-hydroxythreonine-4-phosphate dehydrogenase